MVISSVEGGQTPFEIVHRKIFTPTLKPVTGEPGAEGNVTLPVPAITVQTLVPIAGRFPARIAVVAQTV